MRKLVLDFTEPGETVWDPFAGAATTGVACRELGRRFIGHELDPVIADRGARRLAGKIVELPDPPECPRKQVSIFDGMGGAGA
jgi:DNA modification methylase